MKKSIYLVLILSLFLCCAFEQDKVDTIIEDGVEAVVNHIEPYKIKGEPTTLNLEREFTIDLEREDLAEKGLSDAVTFDIDSEGNIYFARSWEKENCIFKFDSKGNFVTSFIRRGQGPGEIQFIRYFGIDSRDNIIISDHMSRKVFIFNKEGALVKETRYPPVIQAIYPLENGNYLAYWRYTKGGDVDLAADFFPFGFTLYGSKFEEIKDLDIFSLPHPKKKGSRGAPSDPIFIWGISKGNIYIGNEDRGYEILKFDLEGNLLRKIRKEYIPVEIPEELKKKRKEYFEKSGTKIWFPKYWPPYYSFFQDDECRLFVKTHEEGDNPGEHMYDIFNPDGIFISRKSLNIYSWGDTEICAKAKRSRLFCLVEKESGFKELVVYRIRWK